MVQQPLDRTTKSSAESPSADFWSDFANSPIPKWIFEQDTLNFLEVNQAAVQSYGYTRDEFLKRSILDIRPLEDVPALINAACHPRFKGPSTQERWRHRRKNGIVFDVEITSFELNFRGRAAEAVTAVDLSNRAPDIQMLGEESAAGLEIRRRFSRVANPPVR